MLLCSYCHLQIALFLSLATYVVHCCRFIHCLFQVFVGAYNIQIRVIVSNSHYITVFRIFLHVIIKHSQLIGVLFFTKYQSALSLELIHLSFSEFLIEFFILINFFNVRVSVFLHNLGCYFLLSFAYFNTSDNFILSDEERILVFLLFIFLDFMIFKGFDLFFFCLGHWEKV